MIFRYSFLSLVPQISTNCLFSFLHLSALEILPMRQCIPKTVTSALHSFKTLPQDSLAHSSLIHQLPDVFSVLLPLFLGVILFMSSHHENPAALPSSLLSLPPLVPAWALELAVQVSCNLFPIWKYLEMCSILGLLIIL